MQEVPGELQGLEGGPGQAEGGQGAAGLEGEHYLLQGGTDGQQTSARDSAVTEQFLLPISWILLSYLQHWS